MKRRSVVGAIIALVAAIALPASAFAVTAFGNGSFENTGGTYIDNGSGFDTLFAGSTAIPGWTVTSGNIDWIGTYWPAEDGSKSLDMSGNEPGAISQTFATTANATYVVSFWLSGNPYTGCSSPATKTLNVSATGGTTQPYSFDTSAMGNTLTNMMWTTEGYSFVASSSTTTLTFASATAGCAGPALDNVTMTETAPTGADCKDGGWASMYDNNGALFRNQGACVSYYATSGDTPIGS